MHTINAIKVADSSIQIRVSCLNEQMASFFREKCDVAVVQSPGLLGELGKILIGWSPLFQKISFKVLFHSIPRIPRRFRQIKEFFRAEKPDIIHLNSSTLFLPALAAKSLGIPCVMHVRETFGGSDWNLRRKLIARWLINLVDHVMAISEVEKDRMDVTDNPKVSVVYNFVDVKNFVPKKASLKSKTELGIPADHAVFITLGGAGPRKGLNELLHAFSKLPSHFHLIIAGLCPDLTAPLDPKAEAGLKVEDWLIRFKLRPFKFYRYEERLKRSFSTVRHPQRFHFVGHRNDVPDLISASNALLFAGTVPHFPRPIFEAWLLKKPVVVFKMLGISNQVEHGKNGWIVEMKDSNALQRVLTEIWEAPKKANLMGEYGYKKACAKFDSLKNITLILKIYQNLGAR